MTRLPLTCPGRAIPGTSDSEDNDQHVLQAALDTRHQLTWNPTGSKIVVPCLIVLRRNVERVGKEKRRIHVSGTHLDLGFKADGSRRTVEPLPRETVILQVLRNTGIHHHDVFNESGHRHKEHFVGVLAVVGEWKYCAVTGVQYRGLGARIHEHCVGRVESYETVGELGLPPHRLVEHLQA